jgi:CRISPR-associated endoribonuclease Cas6
MFATNLDLAGNPVRFKSVSPIQSKPITATEKIKTLSPITVYDDIVNSEGKKIRSYCLDVYSERFTRLLRNNLIRKASKLYNWDLSDSEFGIECLSNPQIVSATYKHKNNVIKGIDAIFKLTGDERLIQVAYEVGLGSKNAQGWGCIEFAGDK